MNTPTELDALKSQLDNLLEDRLGHISTHADEDDSNAGKGSLETRVSPRIDISKRPAPTPEKKTDHNSPLENIASSLDAPEPSSVAGDDVKIMRKAMDRSAGPFIVYSDDYRIIFANKMARELWPETIQGIEAGLSMMEATINQIRILVPTLSEERIRRIAEETIAQHNSKEPNEVMSAGDRWFRLYHDKVDGEYVCAMGVEITELKRREAQLDEARKTADKANTAKSAFLARMSHEIKTPLNAIVGMSDALMEDVTDPETIETLEYIVTAAEGLSHVLGQTLDHAKLMSEKVVVELQAHDMREMVQKVVGMWKKPCAAKNVKLNIHVHQNIPETLVFDRFRLQQCINNLMSNAVKFTDKGHITVASKMIEKPGKPPYVAIVVQDTGVGMSEEASERIFNAYEQADQSTTRIFGGTGLGLSITKQLIEAMSGSISVQSDLGKGTAFLITLPANMSESEHPIDAVTSLVGHKPTPVPAPEPAQAVEPNLTAVNTDNCNEKPAEADVQSKDMTANEETTPFEGLSVLCVEDNPVNHAVISKLIGQQVKSIAFANNGEEGLKALATQQFDIVLMDIHMPVMDGIEATLKIRGSQKPWADVIIIAVTADPDFQYQKVCRNIGMNDAIGKPVKRQDILDSIARSLDVLKKTHAQRIELPIAV